MGKETIKIVLVGIIYVGVVVNYHLKLQNANEYLASTPASRLNITTDAVEPDDIENFWDHIETWNICAQIGIYGFGVGCIVVGLICAQDRYGISVTMFLEGICLIGKVVVFSVLINTGANHTDVLGLKTAAVVYICFLGVEVVGLGILVIVIICTRCCTNNDDY